MKGLLGVDELKILFSVMKFAAIAALFQLKKLRNSKVVLESGTSYSPFVAEL